MEKLKRTAICVYVDAAILERLKQICKIEEKSQASVITRLIKKHIPIPADGDEEMTPIAKPEQIEPIEEVKPQQAIKQVVSEPKKAIVKAVTKPTDKEPTMMELLKQSRLNN